MAGSRKTKDGRSRVWLDIGAIAFPLFLILTFLAPLNQGLFFGGDLFPFQMAAAVLFVLVAADWFLQGRGNPFRHPLDWAALAFAAGYVLSAIVHPVVAYDAKIAALRGLLFLGWYWSVASLVQGRMRFLWYAWMLYGTSIISATVGCLAAAGKFPFPGAVQTNPLRILGTLQYANSFGALLIAAFIIGVTLQEDSYLRNRRWALAIYGAGNVLIVLTLLGTVSRGAWLIFPVAVGIWWVGLRSETRSRVLVQVLWTIGVSLLLSRPVLNAFTRDRGGHGLIILAVGMLIGSAGAVGYRLADAAWQRQRMTIEMRRLLVGVGVLYGIGVLAFLLYSTASAAIAVAGRGLIASNVAQRAASISVNAESLQAREMMWQDALSLIRHRPVVGYGGGGWEALYHTVQAALYWSSEVHESLLQAWVEGGILAALGLLALAALTFWGAWKLRTADRTKAQPLLLWGLAIAGFGIFLHSLVDFDLSLPALALILWGSAGIVRGMSFGDRAAGTGSPGSSRWMSLGGAVALLVLAGVLFFPSAALEAATTAGTQGAVAMDQHHYAVSYQDYRRAMTLEPGDAHYRADIAQLLALAYTIDPTRTMLHEAAGEALAAIEFDPGNLTVQTTAMTVLGTAQSWADLAETAAALPSKFPLDGSVYDFAAQSLVTAAEGEIQDGSFHAAHTALEAAVALPEEVHRATTEQMTAKTRATTPLPGLSSSGTLALGEADVLLGQDQSALTLLHPLVGPSSGSADIWAAVAMMRLGNTAGAQQLVAPLLSQSEWELQWNLDYRLSGFAKEVQA